MRLEKQIHDYCHIVFVYVILSGKFRYYLSYSASGCLSIEMTLHVL
jgi:hypothetical protein